MKIKLFFLMLLLMSSSIIFAQKKEVAEIKSSLKKEQQKVNKLFNERNNEIAKYQMVVKESKKAEAKVDSLKSKPNSHAYKNAVKKSDELLNQRNQLFVSIEQLNHEIDSINLVIANHESKLQQLETQKAEGKKDKNSKKRNLKRTNNDNNTEVPSNKKMKSIEQDTEVKEGRTLVMQDEEIFIDNEKTDLFEEATEIGDASEESSSLNDDTYTSSFSKFLSKVWKFIKICFWIICGIIFIIIVGKATSSGGSAGHRSSGSSSRGSSSSRSSSSRSSSPSNEHTKKMIKSYQADLERAKARLDKAKLQYKKNPTNTNRGSVEFYTKEVGRIKSIIATKKSHL